MYIFHLLLGKYNRKYILSLNILPDAMTVGWIHNLTFEKFQQVMSFICFQLFKDLVGGK